MPAGALDGVLLVDHHCHGVLRHDLDHPAFQALLSEGGAPAPGLSHFDSALGLAVRRHRAPVLGLEPHAAPSTYLDRRAALGVAEVRRRLLSASATATFLVDTGYRGAEILSPGELGAAAGVGAREVVRLETVAEALGADGVPASGFAQRFAEALSSTVRSVHAVAVKSVAAYRGGLDFAPAPPTRREITAAAGRWLDHGPSRAWRVDDPVITRALLWTAVDLGLPIQFHTGFGDTDLMLHRANPLLLTQFIRAVPPRVPIMLLHCYPYHREAAYLAAAYPHVYLDVGLALTHVGPSRAGAVLAEALELSPYGKMLYSSDAFGLPELYHLGALMFRRGLSALLEGWVDAGECSTADAGRIARLIAADNAARVYRL